MLVDLAKLARACCCLWIGIRHRHRTTESRAAHTDAKGGVEFNQRLSKWRAETVGRLQRLSKWRAETVGRLRVEHYKIPAKHLSTAGFDKSGLKNSSDPKNRPVPATNTAANVAND